MHIMRYKVVKVFDSASHWYYAVVDTKMRKQHSSWVFLNTAQMVQNDLNRWING